MLMRILPVMAILISTARPAVAVDTLWDNGDTNGVNGIAHNSGPFRRTVTDDFEIPPGQTWALRGFQTFMIWNTLPPGSGSTQDRPRRAARIAAQPTGAVETTIAIG